MILIGGGENMERWERLSSIDGGVFVTPDFSFGEDALQLARFSEKKVSALCELGTGCGVISLLLSPFAGQITAVDIQKDAVSLAARSAAQNGLSDKIRVVCADWAHLDGILPAGGFDRVVCNPPYFPPDSGGVSDSPARRIARHEPSPQAITTLSGAAARLLRQGGTFCLCHRPERLCDVLSALRGAGLEPKRLELIRRTPDDAPWLMLCEAKRGGKPGLKIL